MLKGILFGKKKNQANYKEILRISKSRTEIIKEQLHRIDPTITNQLVERIEYIKNNQPLVPRIKKRDYIIAIVINLVITILYFIIIMG
jgi:hypothetical protein